MPALEVGLRTNKHEEEMRWILTMGAVAFELIIQAIA